MNKNTASCTKRIAILLHAILTLTAASVPQENGLEKKSSDDVVRYRSSLLFPAFRIITKYSGSFRVVVRNIGKTNHQTRMKLSSGKTEQPP